MLGGIISLASSGFFRGGSVGNILAQWQAIGVFSYVLPFLLLFALVFVILSKVALFKDNKAVNVIIALSVALMALQFDFVSMFFAEIFPRFGIALSIILVLVIVGGLFFDADNKGFKWLYVILGLIIVSIVIYKSLVAFSWYTGSSTWFNFYWSDALLVIGIVGAFIAIIASGTKPKMPDALIPAYQQKE